LITTIFLDNPTGNGRIITQNNEFLRITEEKDATDDEKKIKQVNVGIYICDIEILIGLISKITNDNKQNEYYLTDIVKIYKSMYIDQIGMFSLPNEKSREITNVNTKGDLIRIDN